MNEEEREIKICKYCKRTEEDIRKEKKETGKRSFCYDRGTEKGFHKFCFKKTGD